MPALDNPGKTFEKYKNALIGVINSNRDSNFFGVTDEIVKRVESKYESLLLEDYTVAELDDEVSQFEAENRNVDLKIKNSAFGREHGNNYENLCLNGAVFENCAFNYVSFKNCDLSRTTFRNCIFDNIGFQECVLHDTKFENCILNCFSIFKCSSYFNEVKSANKSPIELEMDLFNSPTVVNAYHANGGDLSIFLLFRECVLLQVDIRESSISTFVLKNSISFYSNYRESTFDKIHISKCAYFDFGTANHSGKLNGCSVSQLIIKSSRVAQGYVQDCNLGKLELRGCLNFRLGI